MMNYNNLIPKEHYFSFLAFSQKYSNVFNKKSEIKSAWRELMIEVAEGLVN